MNEISLPRRLASEAIGSAFLLATVVGSGIMAERLSGGNAGLALLANAVTGVAKGFSKDLEIQGVGYRAQLAGQSVTFNLGYTHQVDFAVPKGIQITVDKQTKITVAGIDRQQVGQVAAEIRALRPPDVYKGKGVRYVGEVVRKKAGKAGAK